jgi:hypothetical protein
VGGLLRRSEEAKKNLASLAIDTEIRFRSRALLSDRHRHPSPPGNAAFRTRCC